MSTPFNIHINNVGLFLENAEYTIEELQDDGCDNELLKEIEHNVKEAKAELDLFIEQQIENSKPSQLPETMVINTPKGGKVRFSFPDNGYSGDQIKTKGVLVVGETYTVEKIEIGNSSSSVKLKEFTNKTFNTVMFSNV